MVLKPFPSLDLQTRNSSSRKVSLLEVLVWFHENKATIMRKDTCIEPIGTIDHNLLIVNFNALICHYLLFMLALFFYRSLVDILLKQL